MMKMLMSRLREDKAKEAFVLDEYGKFVGLVTLERLLGEMVGDIDEEFIRDVYKRQALDRLEEKAVAHNRDLVRAAALVEIGRAHV